MNRGMYKHEDCMDLTMLVLKIQYRGPKYLKARVEWFVRGVSLLIKQTVKIFNSDFKRWRPQAALVGEK